MTAPANPENLYIRFSTSEDLGRIVEFYQQQKTPYVFPREREVWKERAAAGAVTLIENEGGKIVASSISYPVVTTDKDGLPHHRWTEIGSTIVALEGIGLFKPLLSAQIINAALLEPPADGFVLEIVRSNERSISVFSKLGAEPYTIPPELFAVVQGTFTPESQQRDVAWYRIGTDQAGNMARNLDDLRRAPLLNDKKTGAAYRLDFSRLPQAVYNPEALASAPRPSYRPSQPRP